VLLTVPIRDVEPATPRAKVVRLDLQGSAFPYAAGQALTIATHGLADRRPYSIASAPEDAARDGCLELLVGVDADGTPGPHLNLSVGAVVDVEGPVGGFTFPNRSGVARVLFVAGGTGIAPLRAMIRHALAIGVAEIGVMYSARTSEDFAYEAELRDLAATGRIALRLTVTREADSRWSGPRGRIDASLLAGLLHDRSTLCFVCGPRALVDDVPRTLAGLGVPAERVRVEEW
jgi:ferredoxin-NADP reductase